MENALAKSKGAMGAICVLLVLFTTLLPGVAHAEDGDQVVKSSWTKIICVVDKDSGGVGLGGYYGWKIVATVTVNGGLVTDVVVTGRGESNIQSSVPETEMPYFEPCHFLMEQAIVNAKIDAANPNAVDAVDVVSGATSTSHWIKEATKEALVKWNNNNEAAADIIAKIEAIPGSVDKEAAVQAAREAYDALKDAASYVPADKLKVLTDAEEAIATAVEEAKKAAAAAAAEASLANGTVTVAKASMAYTGKALAPAVTVKSKSGKTLAANTDYTVAYTNNTKVGTATVTVTGKGAYNGTKSATFAIVKAAQPLTVKALKPSVKAGKTLAVKKALTAKKAQGKLTYKLAKVPKKAKGKIAVNAKTGKITVKKSLKKGTYTIKVKVTAKGNANYKSGSKTVSIKLKVK